MTEITSLLEILAYGAILVVPPVVLARLVAGGDGVALDQLFVVPVDPPWPRGVQEEEPVRWRTQLLRPSSRRGVRDVGEARPTELPRRAAQRGLKASEGA